MKLFKAGDYILNPGQIVEGWRYITGIKKGPLNFYFKIIYRDLINGLPIKDPLLLKFKVEEEAIKARDELERQILEG